MIIRDKTIIYSRTLVWTVDNLYIIEIEIDKTLHGNFCISDLMFNMHEKRWLVLLRSAIFKKYLEELTLTLRQQMINLALMLFGGIQTNSKDLIHLFLLPQDFLLLLYIQLVFYRIQLKTRLQTNKQTNMNKTIKNLFPWKSWASYFVFAQKSKLAWACSNL